jgi:hypothetical protein
MADSRKRNQRPLRREHLAGRWEEELWALAYHQIQPPMRRARAPAQVCESEPSQETAGLPLPVAQGA